MSDGIDSNRPGDKTIFNVRMAFAEGVPVAAAQDTTHVLWNGVQDPEDPNAVFKLAFDKLVIRELSCAA